MSVGIFLLPLGLFLVCGGALIHWLNRQNKTGMDSSLLYSLTHDPYAGPVQNALTALDNLEERMRIDRVVYDREMSSLRGSLKTIMKVSVDMRTLTLLELGKTKQSHERLNINDMLQSLVDEMGAVAENKGVRLVLKNDSDRLNVLGDRDELYKVFANIVDNAIKFSSSVDEPCVLIKTRASSRKAVVSIEDNGIGMSNERLSTIGKQPQASTANTIGIPGAGFGLYLATQMVNKAGGKMDIVSHINHGTTVTVTLKATKDTHVPDS